MAYFIEVALNVNHNNGIFTYQSEELPCIGARVLVPFRKSKMLGVVLKILPENSNFDFNIKEIIEIIDEQPIMTKEQFELINFCSQYYLNPLGPNILLAVAKNLKPNKIKTPNFKNKSGDIVLNQDQEDIVSKIFEDLRGRYLLQGITGSGKTIIYIKIAQKMLLKNQSILFLVPEIALTPQMIERVENALGLKVAVLHSGISLAKKRDVYFSLLNGQNKVLIGTRSAIFAPLQKLGLIVVDEEHDGSLKQNDTIRYHARDLALWRAHNEKAMVILGSATPSLESIYNVNNNKLIHLKLNNRYIKERGLPNVEVIDLKARKKDIELKNKDLAYILSEPLRSAIKNSLNENSQVLLFLNQRGFAQFGLCYSCGSSIKCPFCSVSLTYYKKKSMLLCHQCNHCQETLQFCPSCPKEKVHYLGLGTEKLFNEVNQLFLNQKILRLDRDEVKSDQKLKSTLSAMESGEANILIGTQMVTKGHNFPKVSLVGVVLADSSFAQVDFRASERAFQLFTQVAGRAGRGDFSGKAIIQTFNPDHISIKYAKNHDVDGFIKEELAIRKMLGFPPYKKSALIRCEHKDEELITKLLNRTREILQKDPNLTILGPAPCPIMRINMRQRWQMLILCPSSTHLHTSLLKVKNDTFIAQMVNKKSIRFIIDIDPIEMM